MANYLLAQYTIRSKQAYIFRTNALREISGGSALIRDVWNDVLFVAVEELGITYRRAGNDFQAQRKDDPFSLEAFQNSGFRIEELFCGGGNETLLYKDEETYLAVNKAFTRKLLDMCPGMVPLCVAVKTTDDYQTDYKNLMLAVQRAKSSMSQVRETAMLPFSMMDRKTFQPITKILSMDIGNGKRIKKELSAESYAKWKKCRSDERITDRNRMLDDIAGQTDNSHHLLAIVHADGNNMGMKIQKFLGEEKSYNICVSRMRRFVNEIASAFTGDGPDDPKGVLNRYAGEQGKFLRWIVNDGDDATFICDAPDALAFTECYLKAVLNYHSNLGFDFSSCAGICIFHSHYPVSKAYQWAEDACDSAKEKVHFKANEAAKEEAWIDFGYIHSGTTVKMHTARQSQGLTDLARPWKINGSKASQGDALYTVDKFYQMAEILQRSEVSRSRIKNIGSAVEQDNGLHLAKKELQLMYNRHKNLKKELELLFGQEERNILRALYDLYEVYDLWFREEN